MEAAAAETRTYAAIYVTVGKNDTTRFHYFSRGRLWPLTRKIAEASFAAGATVYRKQPGTSIWAEGCAVIGAENAR